MKILKILSLFSFLFTSCIQLKVKQKYFNYCPYKINDILVFGQSINGEQDTIFIKSIKDIGEPDGPVPIFANRHSYYCNGYSSGIKEFLFTKPREQISILKIIPKYKSWEGYRDNNGINFSITKAKSIYLNYFIKFDSLARIQTRSINVNDTEYDNVKEINTNMKSISPICIKKFYWREDIGYLKFITLNGIEYNLITKYNDPKLIERINLEERRKEELWKK